MAARSKGDRGWWVGLVEGTAPEEVAGGILGVRNCAKRALSAFQTKRSGSGIAATRTMSTIPPRTGRSATKSTKRMAMRAKSWRKTLTTLPGWPPPGVSR